jgi:hypothetical protein
MFCTATSALSAVCVQCPISLFSEVNDAMLSRSVAQVLSEWF